jgi:hypothetical protein
VWEKEKKKYWGQVLNEGIAKKESDRERERKGQGDRAGERNRERRGRKESA